MSTIASVDHGNELQAVTATVGDNCAHDGLEHENPATMAQISIADSSCLEALPDELLTPIIKELVYDENRSGWSARFAARDDLRSLCLVSKRIDLITRPYLYKKVFISCFDSLAKLHRTISRDPHLGDEIREIDLGVSFGSATFSKRLTAAEHKEFLDEFNQFRADGRFPTSSRLVGDLCYGVLARAVNICSLKMALENSESGNVRFTQEYFMQLYNRNHLTAYSDFFDRVRHASRSNASGVVFLPRLETLTLCGLSRPLGIEVFEHFLDLPSLRTVQSRYDDGNWCTLVPGASRSGRYRRGEFIPPSVGPAALQRSPQRKTSTYV
ncbi:hypothetical protein UCDDA912_g04144 [Diaporthe ampelina]|uniref:F-box domain-containing protein n=1 Tax=Diaporthe ampelina TaxID=1214573 RepID=A0A0G2FNF4_9PEZI|nr:hypothetical protein UCDDA912_g04144 [Diaporthe ampelina]